MAADPYKTLGVTRQADADEIRKAYRALAKKYHPDRNPDDKEAEDKFKEASGAFDILGDKDKKAKFDRGEIDGEGNPRHPFGGGGPFSGGAHQANRGRQHNPRDFEEFGDIFSDLFNGGMRGNRAGGFGGGADPRRPVAGRDQKYRMEVDFLEAATGVTKRVTMGDGRTLDVTIPEGLRDGQTLRLRGQGEPGRNGGPAGDVYVDVTVRPHRFFTLEGDVIRVEVPVTLSEAVLGAKIKIPTIHGDVAVSIPKGASSGLALRLKGKGIKDPKTGERGDQIARLKIVLPSKPDEALEAFIANWRGDKGANPRGRLKK